MFDIGPSLQEARTRRGLTPEDVQKAIRIRDRYLRAIEEEHWEMLPGDAYAKGFLRTYAEFLGLNGNLYVDEYNSRFTGHGEAAFVPEAMTPVDSARIGLLRPVVAIAAIVVAVAAVAAWQLRGSSATDTLKGPTDAAAATETTARQPEQQPASKPKPAHKPKPAATPAATPTRASLTALGRVWLQVRTGDAQGPVLFEGVLARGKTLPVKLAPKVWVRVGAPWNLQVRIGGKVVGGLPQKVGTILVTPTGIRRIG